MAKAKTRQSGDRLSRRFEGKEVLDELLSLAGSPCDTEGVLEAFTQGSAEGLSPDELIPSLFEGEPHFPDPSLAARLFGNLLGLWDQVAAGEKVVLAAPERPARPKKVKPTPPAPFFPEEPSEEFVEAAWRFLEDDARERTRLLHAFENRQDALLQWLDEAELSEPAYAAARFLLFEVFAMLSLGWPSGVGSVAVGQAPAGEVPQALAAYADEALFEAEQDDEAPIAQEEARRLRELVTSALSALWAARRR